MTGNKLGRASNGRAFAVLMGSNDDLSWTVHGSRSPRPDRVGVGRLRGEEYGSSLRQTVAPTAVIAGRLLRLDEPSLRGLELLVAERAVAVKGRESLQFIHKRRTRGAGVVLGRVVLLLRRRL